MHNPVLQCLMQFLMQSIPLRCCRINSPCADKELRYFFMVWWRFAESNPGSWGLVKSLEPVCRKNATTGDVRTTAGAEDVVTLFSSVNSTAMPSNSCVATDMDLVASAAVSGVLKEPQGSRRSLRVQAKSATKATPKRVVSPYFAKKPAAGKTAKRSVAISAKTQVVQQSSEDNEGKPQASVSRPLHADNYRLLAAEFYACDSLDLAPRLLGKLLRRDDVILQITEVEAYRPGDTACHARVGQTSRTEAMFRAGGHAYLFLCYGINVMLNVVADKEGVGSAVLIRACSPVAGLKTIMQRRKQDTVKPVLLTGPGKVGQALGLTVDWSCHPLFVPGGLELLDGPAPEAILAGPRVGIDYAAPEDVAAPWRFGIAGTPWVSAPRATLLPIPPSSATI